MDNYETVTAAINGLKAKGYTLNFNIEFDKLLCKDNNISLDPHQFEITAFYRFEGDSNPSDEDIVYAIESKDGLMKGIVTSAFGMYADNVSTALLNKFTIHHK